MRNDNELHRIAAELCEIDGEGYRLEGLEDQRNRERLAQWFAKGGPQQRLTERLIAYSNQLEAALEVDVAAARSVA